MLPFILLLAAFRGVGEECGEGAERMGGETQDLRQGSSRLRFSPGESLCLGTDTVGG